MLCQIVINKQLTYDIYVGKVLKCFSDSKSRKNNATLTQMQEKKMYAICWIDFHVNAVRKDLSPTDKSDNQHLPFCIHYINTYSGNL